MNWEWIAFPFTDICSAASMTTLKEQGRMDVIEQMNDTVSGCLVEAKVTSSVSAGMGQVSVEAITLGADSKRWVGI